MESKVKSGPAEKRDPGFGREELFWLAVTKSAPFDGKDFPARDWKRWESDGCQGRPTANLPGRPQVVSFVRRTGSLVASEVDDNAMILGNFTWGGRRSYYRDEIESAVRASREWGLKWIDRTTGRAEGGIFLREVGVEVSRRAVASDIEAYEGFLIGLPWRWASRCREVMRAPTIKDLREAGLSPLDLPDKLDPFVEKFLKGETSDDEKPA